MQNKGQAGFEQFCFIVRLRPNLQEFLSFIKSVLQALIHLVRDKILQGANWVSNWLSLLK